MVYATMRSGYRSGGINTQSINTAALTALPEEVQDYEVGVKSDFTVMDMPVRTNLRAYQTAYHNIQVQQHDAQRHAGDRAIGGGPCTQAAAQRQPAASTISTTISRSMPRRRASMAWNGTSRRLPTDWLTLNASGSYIDPRFTDFTFVAPPGYLLPATSTNLSGTPIPVPALADQRDRDRQFRRSAISACRSAIRCSRRIIIGRAAIWRTCAASIPSQRTFAYGLLNVRLDFTDVGKSGTDLAFFMNNVANTEACLPEYNGVLNSAPNGTFGTPRHLGRAAMHAAAAAHDGRSGDL